MGRMKNDSGLRQALYVFRATLHGDQIVLPMPIVLALVTFRLATSSFSYDQF